MAKPKLECSFCGRKKPETNLLIAGIDAHICDKCIEQAHGIVLEELKSAGMYTPEMDEALKLDDSKMNDISTDPRLKQAQMNALMKLQEISDNDGLTMQDKAQLGQIQNEVNSNLKGNTDAIQQNKITIEIDINLILVTMFLHFC